WLASHDRLLTNVERGRRHLTNQVVCPRCSVQAENLQHIFLDCPFALQVWNNVLPSAIQNRSKCWKTNQLGREAPGLARQTYLIAWQPGDEDWFTLNTDGSSLSLNGSTTIGGLIRDPHSRFVRAFCANVGDCSITRAELRGIVEGLKLAWDLGIRKIAVQTDSRAAISILEQDMHMVRQHAALVADFHELRSRNWEVSLSHVYREANCAADYLANLGHSYSFGLHLLDVPNSSLAH
ncbi:Putative ribonuclease H protein At1g65750, partial [Linum perenne]